MSDIGSRTAFELVSAGYSVKEKQPFRIRDKYHPEGLSRSTLTIVDCEDRVAFVVHGYWSKEKRIWDQEELWWRAECLLGYFNMSAPEDTGGIT